MYAIVRVSGRQYRAVPGTVIDVDKMTVEPGTTVNLSDVLLVVPDGGQPNIGHPLVEGASVQVTVIEHYRAPKILVWKYRPGLRYRKRRGHRQPYTRLHIDAVNGL
jgi:large subunit ribosomal protein L21